MVRKPHLTPQQCLWLDEIHQVALKLDLRGSALVGAFSGRFDGHLSEMDVHPLVKQRLLRWSAADHACSTDALGVRRTVGLTPKAIAIFWPGRAAARSRSRRVPPPTACSGIAGQ